jgi:heme/copper-type cytochrome/quinol oxidase subunit 2
MTIRKIACRFAVLSALMFLWADSAQACPNCKLALETESPLPRAYMVSILFMMGTIFLLFGVVAAGVMWLTRQEQRSLEQAGYGHLFENGVTQQAAGSNAG